MDSIYERIRRRAKILASRYPAPGFYRDFAPSVKISSRLLDEDPLLRQVVLVARSRLEDDLGHGLRHAAKVTVDAGALAHISAHKQGQDPEAARQWMVLAQCAGLLHDICRKEKNHAQKGAQTARELLSAFSLAADEVEDVCQAIANHEAFKAQTPVNTLRGKALSDCLYDADKFRWGPDNFTETVWSMAAFYQVPIEDFVRHYPRGVKGIARIRETFRSETGKQYGPEFIDQGLALGEEILHMIQTDFLDR